MGILTAEMQRVVREQRLGYVATVCPDGTPNLSPRGTLTVWDDEHLIFADIRSPGTTRNLRHNPACEVNVIDPIGRRGFRFKGRVEIVDGGPRLAEAIAFYRERGTTSPIRAVILIRVERATPVISPAYDTGATEEEVRERWERYWQDSRVEHGQ